MSIPPTFVPTVRGPRGKGFRTKRARRRTEARHAVHTRPRPTSNREPA